RRVLVLCMMSYYSFNPFLQVDQTYVLFIPIPSHLLCFSSPFPGGTASLVLQLSILWILGFFNKKRRKQQDMPQLLSARGKEFAFLSSHTVDLSNVFLANDQLYSAILSSRQNLPENCRAIIVGVYVLTSKNN
ncbi:hypothetical protein ACJX0J_020142, partial [Zea mays]